MLLVVRTGSHGAFSRFHGTIQLACVQESFAQMGEPHRLIHHQVHAGGVVDRLAENRDRFGRSIG
jgi:hypothetical protein